MIVHSHPSSGKHHTHTTGQVISIAHLSTIHTLEAEVQAEMTVFRPLLYVLEYKINTFRAKALSARKRFARNVSICALLLFIAETKVYLLMEYIRAIPLADGNVFLP